MVCYRVSFSTVDGYWAEAKEERGGRLGLGLAARGPIVTNGSFPASVKAVFFDAVGTLIHPEPSAATVYHSVGMRHGSRLDHATVKARFRAAFRRQRRTGKAS